MWDFHRQEFFEKRIKKFSVPIDKVGTQIKEFYLFYGLKIICLLYTSDAADEA